jgi:hypothetical protein
MVYIHINITRYTNRERKNCYQESGQNYGSEKEGERKRGDTTIRMK